MRHEIVGYALRLTTNYFSPLENSPAVWLPLTNELAQKIIANNTVNVMSSDELKNTYRKLYIQLVSTTCRNLGRRPDGHFGPCGFCDICEINNALE